ncbi:AAA family ATPase [Microlunatus lacustris]
MIVPVHLVMMFGPSAVGKMAVGRELSRLAGYPLFHNHMSIEPVLEVFPWGSPSFQRLTSELRRRVVEEAVAADLPGLIFTYVWALDDPADREYVDWLTEPVRTAGGRLDFVELYADQATRLAREGTALRLEHKRSKRDLEATRRRLLEDDAAHQLSTSGDFVYPDQHLRLDNSHLTPAEAASRIAQHLQLIPRAGAD